MSGEYIQAYICPVCHDDHSLGPHRFSDDELAARDAAIRAEGIAIGYRDGMKDGAAQTRAEVAREIRGEADRVREMRPKYAAGIERGAWIAEGTP